MKLIIFTRPLIKVLALFAFVGGLALVVYLMSGLPAPREENRVGPTNGAFSIIKPPDWESQVTYAPLDKQYVTALDLRPIKSVGREQRIFVGRRRNPPDLEKLKQSGTRQATFQGRDAWVFAGKQKYLFVWRATFERAGAWYDLALWLTREDDVPNSEWWPYLTSFRAQDLPAAGPTSMPGTLPTTLPGLEQLPG